MSFPDKSKFQSKDASLLGGTAPIVHPASIDPPQSSRTVPMEVMAFGLARTGTASLRSALYSLGYFDVYHMQAAARENPKDCDMWCDALDAKFEGKGVFPRENWDKLLGHCMAITDNPCSAFAPELLVAYPEAKVILTVRDSAESHHKSMMSTVVPFYSEYIPTWNPFVFFYRLLLPESPADRMFRRFAKAMDYATWGKKGKKKYLDYNETIRRMVSNENLLEFNPNDGWGPLCQFLGKKIPDIPYPRVNDTAYYQKRIGMRKFYRHLVAGARGSGMLLIFVVAFYITKKWKAG